MKDFRLFQELILKETGISLADSKCDLLRGRLRKRLVFHGLSKFRDYYDLLNRNDRDGIELIELINCVTTNKTDFYRESHHFTFLKDTAYPELVELAKSTGAKKLRIWSAACSTGEEPYSIAMTTQDFFRLHPGWDIRILASDIDSTVLQKASEGLYDESRVVQLPMDVKRRGFLKGKGSSAGKVRVLTALRDMVTFRRINFADDAWPIRTKFDLIFCRNAMIYFDRDFQEKLLRRFLQYLNPHGYLILGHSENVTWMKELEPLGQTIYKPRYPAEQNTALPAPSLSERMKTRTQAQKRGRAEAKKTARPQPAPQTQPKSKPRPRPVRRGPVQAGPAAPTTKLKRKAIVAGEVFASQEHMEISTLLGSCIAACLYDPDVQVGGMNHFLLPVGSGVNAETACYGINAMELLINELMMRGGQRSRMVAKLYGGARVLSDQLQSSRVGEKNVDFVRKYLTTEGIPIVEQKVGGSAGLRVVMIADTGAVTASELESTKNRELLADDRSALKIANRDAQQPEPDQIMLF